MKKKNLLMTAIAIFGLATITSAQVPSYVPTSGLVGWWPFNGNANDESGNGNHGTVNGATLTIDRFGQANKAYSFNNNVITTNYFGISGSGSRTISFWIKTNSNNDMHTVTYGGIPNGSNAGDAFNCTFNYGSSGVNANTGYSAITYQCPTPVNNNQWSHYIWVFDSIPNPTTQNIKIYQNSVLLTNAIYNFNPTAALNSNTAIVPLRFGKDTVGYHPFLGNLDDIGIWNRALTQQEITDVYNGCQLAVNTQPTNQTININNNVQFVVGSSDPGATYQWQTDLGMGFQNINSVGQYSGTTTNTLSVSNVSMSNNNQPFRCIVSSGLCSDTSDVAVLTVNDNASIDEANQDNLFTVSPNPAQSIITVKADKAIIGAVYSIYDNTGKVVLTGKLHSENTSIELGNLSDGIYIFKVGEKIKQTFKVIKE